MTDDVEMAGAGRGELAVAAAAGVLACSTAGPAPHVARERTVDVARATADVDAWLDRSLREQVAAMHAGVLSSEDLALGYLDRIDLLDTGPDGLHAVLSVIDEPVRRAAQLDTWRHDARALHGAVVLIKDNIDMRELPTTAGSLALFDNVPAADAPAIARLRAAGAVLLGKTNLSEWANFRGYGSSSGWSSLGGQTRSAIDLDYTPCGSSSGSAVAVAAGLASAAIGTETDGSIVCPAAMNGVVGFKPTVGLVSRAGIVPISRSQDTAGPITKSVGDAARVLGVLAGADPTDPATAAIPATLSLDFESPLPDASLYGARLGVVAGLVDDPRVAVVFADARARLAAAGAVLVDVELPQYAEYADDELTVMLHEFHLDLDAYLARHARAGQPASLTELIAFDRDHAETVMPQFGQELFVRAAQTRGLYDPSYVAALARARRTVGEHGIVAVLGRDRLDALIAPTASPAWEIEPHAGDPWAQVASSPAAVAGCPHLTVPMGHVDHLPVGLSIFAGPWRDAAVLALGHAFEQL